MSTRATIYVHLRTENPKSKPIFKFYQHTDWYVEGLWVNLVRWFMSYSSDLDLDHCLKKANYMHQNKFEFTIRNHWDTEYVYHIYVNKGRKNRLRITYQGWNYFGDEEIINKEKEHDLMLIEYDNKKKELTKWHDSKLEKQMWEDCLYNIKEFITRPNFYTDYVFFKRYGIHDIDHFRRIIEDDVKAYNDLRAREDIESNQKMEMEDVILKNIYDKFADQFGYERWQYFYY